METAVLNSIDITLVLVPLAFFLDLALGDPVYLLHPIRIIGDRVVAPFERTIRSRGVNGCWGGVLLLIYTLTIATGTVLTLNCFLKGFQVIYILFNLYIISVYVVSILD